MLKFGFLFFYLIHHFRNFTESDMRIKKQIDFECFTFRPSCHFSRFRYIFKLSAPYIP